MKETSHLETGRQHMAFEPSTNTVKLGGIFLGIVPIL